MHPPNRTRRYTCRCGKASIVVPAGSWTAHALAQAKVSEHAKTCPRAHEPWTFVVLGNGERPGEPDDPGPPDAESP